MTPNAARRAWLDTLTLAERLEYDRAFGEFWFDKGPWPAAAHEYAKNRIRKRKSEHATPPTHPPQPQPPLPTHSQPLRLVDASS